MCFIRTKRVGKTMPETSFVKKTVLTHDFFKGKVLKSIWKKCFYLPRRLTLKFCTAHCSTDASIKH